MGQCLARQPAAVLQAAELHRPDAVTLLAELGFDVNAVQRISALHEAAGAGDLAMAQLLLSLGADPNLKDCSFDSAPLGWAEHGRHQQVIDLLAPLTETDRG
ncbi:MAG: ankyrin repeat domain-containing protein [Streptosporangiaceae bacterium]